MSAITLRGVGKRYTVVEGQPMLVTRLFTHPGRRRRVRRLWALEDVSFTVARGETIGIIGRNGSGKTTLLKLLSGVSAPTTGHLRVQGVIAPLIGVGVGFNSELTGRENVFVNGRLLGLSQAELTRSFDSIVAFSEIEPFIDAPVKYYSSGMFLRLAFAVAIHTHPDVLIVDEVLAVGDLAFQAKCNEHMRAVQADGTTIVIVTHSLPTLDRMAGRTLLLSAGHLVFDGPTEAAIGAYHELLQSEGTQTAGVDALLRSGAGEEVFSGGALLSVRITDAAGTGVRQFAAGQPIRVHLRAEFTRPISDPLVGVMVAPMKSDYPAYAMHTQPGSYRGHHGPGAPLEVVIHLDNPLLAGSYRLAASLYDADGETLIAAAAPEPFYVTSGTPAIGVVDLRARVEVAGHQVPTPRLRRLGEP